MGGRHVSHAAKMDNPKTKAMLVRVFSRNVIYDDRPPTISKDLTQKQAALLRTLQFELLMDKNWATAKDLCAIPNLEKVYEKNFGAVLTSDIGKHLLLSYNDKTEKVRRYCINYPKLVDLSKMVIEFDYDKHVICGTCGAVHAAMDMRPDHSNHCDNLFREDASLKNIVNELKKLSRYWKSVENVPFYGTTSVSVAPTLPDVEVELADSEDDGSIIWEDCGATLEVAKPLRVTEMKGSQVRRLMFLNEGFAAKKKMHQMDRHDKQADWVRQQLLSTCHRRYSIKDLYDQVVHEWNKTRSVSYQDQHQQDLTESYLAEYLIKRHLEVRPGVYGASSRQSPATPARFLDELCRNPSGVYTPAQLAETVGTTFALSAKECWEKVQQWGASSRLVDAYSDKRGSDVEAVLVLEACEWKKETRGLTILLKYLLESSPAFPTYQACEAARAERMNPGGVDAGQPQPNKRQRRSGV